MWGEHKTRLLLASLPCQLPSSAPCAFKVPKPHSTIKHQALHSSAHIVRPSEKLYAYNTNTTLAIGSGQRVSVSHCVADASEHFHNASTTVPSATHSLLYSITCARVFRFLASQDMSSVPPPCDALLKLPDATKSTKAEQAQWKDTDTLRTVMSIVGPPVASSNGDKQRKTV